MYYNSDGSIQAEYQYIYNANGQLRLRYKLKPQGRRLASITKGNDTYSYEYDMSGVRSVKLADGLRHEYVTQNGQVIRDYVTNADTGAFVRCLDFFYDQSGRPFAMRKYRDSTLSGYNTYHYVLNAQGDVVQLNYQGKQNKVYAQYSYDAWGNILSVSPAQSEDLTVANLNPLRYRGYYCDTETGFYYLQSRYYDPALGRFINADCYTSTGQDYIGYNMFAYCGNNPIARADRDGEFWHIVVGAVVGAVVNTVITVADAVIHDKPIDVGDILISATTGVAGGALAASGAGLVTSIAGNAAISMAGNAAGQIKDKGFKDFDFVDLAIDGAIGAVAGKAGGRGVSYGNAKAAMSLGKQVTKRVVSAATHGKLTKTVFKKSASNYLKNMCAIGGVKIYNELARSVAKGGITAFVGTSIIKSKLR